MSIEIDYGREEISSFTQSARAGEFSFDETAVMAVVSLYDTMIQDLLGLRQDFYDAQKAGGFGGFPSGLELQQGFAQKAADGIDVLTQLVDAAMQMQEGLLCAANKISEADTLNQRRIALLESAIGGQAR
ncbi:hypothetical protein ACFWU5_19340 [Nocardia sp. NPDC058640]|uniref:hypothetical protein n=1 Tax=Nocardia sp. NPDC058640 TaxID=3346571 RepID=UPI00365CF291